MPCAGVAYAYPEASWRGARCFDAGGLRPWDLSRRQLRAFAESMGAGHIPVLVEHDAGRRIGRVTRAATDPLSGGLAVEMELHAAPPPGMNELSLRHDCGDDASGSASIWPVEVSVVSRGARRGCRLFNDASLEDVLQAMASEPVQAPESMAAEPAAPTSAAQMSGVEIVEAAANSMPPDQAQALMDLFGEMAKTKMSAESESVELKKQVEEMRRQMEDINAMGAREFESVFANLRKYLPENAIAQDTVKAILDLVGEKPDVRQHVQTLVSACASAMSSGSVAGLGKRRREGRAGEENAPQAKVDPAVGKFPAWLMEAVNAARPGDTVSADQLGLGKVAMRGGI